MTYSGLKQKIVRNYISILGSDGTLRMNVPEGTDGAVRREYETSDGKTGVKHELVFTEVSGMIDDIQLFEGDFGKNIQFALTKDGGEVVLSVSANSNFGEDLLKKIPSIDLDKEVTFAPYSFEDEHGNKRKGVTVKQDGNKVMSYFHSAPEKEGERPKAIHDYPEPKGDTKKYDADKWKLYFAEARMFTLDYLTEHILPKFADKVRVVDVEKVEVVDDENIPF